jgi:hypothetical protein
VETANTSAETPDNVAETPKEESPIAAAIKALVAAILEEAGERVIESPEFEGRVEQLAEGTLESSGYLSSLIEGAIGDADISYQVEEVVENMDLSCQVESALDCMDLDSQVERSLESLDIPNCDHVSDIIRDVTATLEGRIGVLEGGTEDSDDERLSNLETFEYRTMERLGVLEEAATSPDGVADAIRADKNKVKSALGLHVDDIPGMFELSERVGCIEEDGETSNKRLCDRTHQLATRLDSMEAAVNATVGSSPAGAETMRRAIVELKEAVKRVASMQIRLGELEQSTTSQFGRLDNIQIAFRGLVETMFAK